MDSRIALNDADSIYQAAGYAALSFIFVALAALLFYVACSKRYRLNWFEKNLLERAQDEEVGHSHEALMSAGCASACPGPSDGNQGARNADSSPDSFWVPSRLQRRSSDDLPSPDESLAGSPESPCSHRSFGGDSLHTLGTSTPPCPPCPLTRNDRHVVLAAAPPSRPRVASMQAKLDHTKIDSSMYQQDSPPRTPNNSESIQGSMHITLQYDPSAGILTVRLIEAQDLQARDFSGTADPYAKIRLLPDRNNVWQTRIHKRTLNPVFDEDFVFEVSPTAIALRTLEVLLYDFDAYSRHVCIGGSQIPLSQVDLSERVDIWRGLGPCEDRDAKADLGDLMISMSYLPSAERLTVVVIKARNLRVVDDSRTSSDPFVKVSLLHNGKRLKKRKTSVHRNTVNPVFNEALTFDLSRDTLRRSTIEFCVLHDSLLGASEPLGKATVGTGAGRAPEEKEFFAEMFRTKSATARWLPLQDPRNQKD
ncbi:synaptotagmin-5-like [Ctenocephalides felis]|uniref:synaptotagmin-5-like n=1 Tax=Ctenocephalides felis TaxID=7515 RepID=UPI000E6E300E|nr:synaptotagmin-5-like [Ctenocephalides felis]XP_026469814.1 synaptotagmin-5-like [Ctenocephalides felis]